MSKLIEKIKGKSEGGSGLTQGSKFPTNLGLLKEDSVEKGTVDINGLKGKNLVVAVPGAFSSTCSNQVPGYVEHAEQFAAKGVQGVYVVAVNDVFVRYWVHCKRDVANRTITGNEGMEEGSQSGVQSSFPLHCR